MQLRFSHIVNPYGVNGQLDRIQKLTLQMLKSAAGAAKHMVCLATTQFPQDRNLIPQGFRITSDLERSVKKTGKLDMDLPLIADVLEKLKETEPADYFIYSNMDIIPVPEFYNGIAALILKNNCDALIVNRRRISAELIDQPDLMWAQTGLPHPGYDCFVFRAELLEKFDLGDVVIGAPGLGFMIAHNLFLHAHKVKVVTNKHLTLHLGYEIAGKWKGSAAENHQRTEVKRFIAVNKKNFRISSFPGYNFPFFKRHFRWLMNPLFIYPLMFRLDMKAMGDGRTIISPERKDSAFLEWVSSRADFDEC